MENGPNDKALLSSRVSDLKSMLLIRAIFQRVHRFIERLNTLGHMLLHLIGNLLECLDKPFIFCRIASVNNLVGQMRLMMESRLDLLKALKIGTCRFPREDPRGPLGV